MKIENKPKKERIHWQCKRGMLELELILLDFYENYFYKLSDELALEFEQLLELPDPDLLNALILDEKPLYFAQIVDYIKNTKNPKIFN